MMYGTSQLLMLAYYLRSSYMLALALLYCFENIYYIYIFNNISITIQVYKSSLLL